MPFVIDGAGVQTQGQKEILAELAALAKDPSIFGPSALADDPSTRLGQFLNIIAGQFAHLQQIIAAFYTQLDPDAAKGDMLNVHALFAGITPEGARASATTSGGTLVASGATTVSAGFKVKNDRTGETWATVAETVFAGAGSLDVGIQALTPGPSTYQAGDTWTLLDSANNLSAFTTATDIDPEDIGQDRESEESILQRVRSARLANGNDLQAMVRNVRDVPGVQYAGGLENRNDYPLSGVPGRAFEIVVEGGSDAAIAQAIYDSKPPGAESHGTSSAPIQLPTGQDIVIRFSRVEDVDASIYVYVSRLDAEFEPPFNYRELVKQAVLAQANSEAEPGVDVIFDAFEKTVWETTNRPDGKHTLSNVEVFGSVDNEVAGLAILQVDHKQRADFDSSRVFVIER